MRSSARDAIFPVAITRKVSPGIGRCELTHVSRHVIDLDLAAEQHRRYEECLEDLGCRILSLPAEPDLPDSVFVEDAAIVLDELAIITRPGAPSRRPETSSIARALEPFRRLEYIRPPGTVDGGDILRIGRDLFVGASGRTNKEGANQLTALAGPFGYRITRVAVEGCLHLKSAATQVAKGMLVLNPRWVDGRLFAGMNLVEVDPSEPHAGNALLVGATVVCSFAYPRTRARLERLGIEVKDVDMSEMAKAEGGLTCCSLIILPGSAGFQPPEMQ